ncbi:uncharacterized protein [Watersipora subatra]|uniref:uncharacterized protein n=1 Tax=Watersipora subatra TaxID=2589382 RepID=UPI00355C06F1
MVIRELLILAAILVSANSQTIPEKCTWSENDCEELQTSRDFPINCDKRHNNNGGTVYSCKEACSSPDNFLCSYDYCIGYRSWCLRSKSSTALTSTPPPSFPSALRSSITMKQPNTTEAPSQQEITPKASELTKCRPIKMSTLEIVLIVILSLSWLIAIFPMIGFKKKTFCDRWGRIKAKLQGNNQMNTQTSENLVLSESRPRGGEPEDGLLESLLRQLMSCKDITCYVGTLNRLYKLLKQKIDADPEYWAKVEKANAQMRRKGMQRLESESGPIDPENLSTADGGASESRRLLNASNDAISSEVNFADFKLCDIYHMIQSHWRQGEDPQGRQG